MSAPASSTYSFKVVLLGEGRVGKTCLCLRYVRGVFNSEQESTIAATYLDKRFHVGQRLVRLMLWDTAGQERFHALSPIYYREAQGAILVYDITDRDSFTKVRNWVKELRKIVGKSIVLVIAGNKIDMEKKRQVDDAEAVEYAKSVGAYHITCSAKTGKNVEAAFLELTKGMLRLQRQKEEEGGASSSSSSSSSSASNGKASAAGSRKNITIEDERVKPKDGCCS